MGDPWYAETQKRNQRAGPLAAPGSTGVGPTAVCSTICAFVEQDVMFNKPNFC